MVFSFAKKLPQNEEKVVSNSPNNQEDSKETKSESQCSIAINADIVEEYC